VAPGTSRKCGIRRKLRYHQSTELDEKPPSTQAPESGA